MRKLGTAVALALSLGVSGCVEQKFEIFSSQENSSYLENIISPEENPPHLENIVSPEENSEILEEVIAQFDESLHDYIRAIPIVKNNWIDTASALTETAVELNCSAINCGDNYETPEIRVSSLWDEKKENGEPYFSDSFKKNLLRHEFLHMIEAHQEIKVILFHEKFENWYLDEEYGKPYPAFNRTKYILWHNLYSSEDWTNMAYNERYADSYPGREQFAYIGAEIMDDTTRFYGRQRLREIPEEIIYFYDGIVRSDLLGK